MRIVLLNDRIPPEGRGGAEAVVWRLANGLMAAGHDVHVIATTTGTPFEEVRAGIPTYHIRAAYPERFRAWLSLWNPQTVRAFRKLLQRIQPDIVNAHNIHFYLSYHTLKLANEAGCGVVFSGHDAMPFAYGKLTHFARPDASEMQLPGDYRLPPLYNLRRNRLRYDPFRNPVITRYLKRYAHVLTVPSRALAQAWLANALPAPEVVHNGIDTEEWASPSAARVAALRKTLDLEDKQVILIAGRLTREKGMLHLLSALDHLRQHMPTARLLVLTARESARQLPEKYQHLRPLICKGGWLSGEDLRAAYQLADVVTVPSIYLDPFPTVNLEAMALAKPVIATCFGGSKEVVVDGETGFIVNPFDTATFAERLERLLRDESLRRTMGERGRQRILDQFSLTQQVEQMVSIYERALTRRDK